jgi:hypothetical protein
VFGSQWHFPLASLALCQNDFPDANSRLKYLRGAIALEEARLKTEPYDGVTCLA